MTFDLPRASAFAALLIAVCGYALIVRPLETSIAERYGELEVARTLIQRNVILAGRIPSLERERAKLERELQRLHVTERSATVSARFLHAIAALSGHDGVAVESVAAAVHQTVPPPTHAAQLPLLEEVPLDLTLRGNYGDVLRAVRDLVRSEVPAGMTLATLGAAGRRPGEPPLLNAALHVTLLREPDDATSARARSL